jgi:hypothetical protein
MNDALVGGVVVVTFVLPTILFGAVFAGVGGFLYLESSEAADTYEPTNATVLSSHVEETTDDVEDTPTYRPAVTYEYTVDGETYRSSNVLPGPGLTSRSDRGWARGIVADHPEGATVTAYYDSEGPSNAFLVRDDQQFLPLVFAGTGVVIVLFGVVTLIGVVGWVLR